VFARVKSPFIDLINNVDAARQSDGRLAAMQGMAAGANAYQAGSAIANATKGAGSGALFSAEAGIGFKSSSSSADGSSTVSRGSTIQGGGNVNLTSTSGDIHVVQGNLSAGNTLALDSAGDILLEAGKAHLQDKSKSNTAGAEVGVGVSVGAQTGVYVYAEASVGSSKSNSDSSTWQNTILTGQNISLKAEGDTTLRGATATADRIDVKTGGTLTIESLQDIAESMSKDSQVGGRVQVSIGTAWDASGYASANKANGSYKGVGQQSGLFAGDGGYHVDAGHVNLIGGAIASTNGANSELTAGSFTFTDLKNEMDYRTSSASISGGYGGKLGEGSASQNAPGQFKEIGSNVESQAVGSPGGPNFGGGMPIISSGSDSSTTYATLTEGNITIGGKKVTAAELGVNTDASKAHEAISNLPNLRKLMQEQQAMSSAAGTVLVTSKQIAGDVAAAKTDAAVKAYVASLDPDARAAFGGMSAEDQRAALRHDAGYNEAQKWATGGSYGRALDAVTTAIVGSMTGQGGQVAANALAPYAAEFIGSKFDPNHGEDPNATMQLISHALLGALLAEANGGAGANGALAAAGGELAAKFLTDALYNDNPGDLDEQQKQTILALSQVVGALAGSFGGSGLDGASLGAKIAANVVENNYLSHPQRDQRSKEIMDCGKDAACKFAVDARWAEVSQDQSRVMKDRYLSYLTPEEQSILFSLKPGSEAYDGILAHALLRESNKGPLYKASLATFDFKLLTQTDWAGAQVSAMPSGMSLTDRNRLELALLGPIAGLPSTIAHYAGASPETIAMTNQAGMIAWDVAGSLAAVGPRYSAAGMQQPGRLTSMQDGRNGVEYAYAFDMLALRGAIAETRAGLSSKYKNSGNAASAEIQLSDYRDYMVAHSGVNAAGKGLIGSGSENYPYLTVKSKSGILLSREVDSEYKIFDNLTDAYGRNSFPTGRIYLFTELPPCASCAGVIESFRARYPFINVDVYHNFNEKRLSPKELKREH